MSKPTRSGIFLEKRHQRLQDEAKFRRSPQLPRSWYTKRLGEFGEVAGNAAKIGGLVWTFGAIIGMILLLAYLQSEGAPFPTVDSSLLLLLAMIGGIFSFLFLLLGAYILLVPLLKIVIPKEAQPGFQALFSEGKNGRQYLYDYVFFFAPFLLPVITSLVSLPMHLSECERFTGPFVMMIIGLAAPVLYSRRVVGGVRFFEVILGSYVASFVSLSWFLFLGRLALRISRSTPNISSSAAYPLLVIVIIFLLVFHLILSSGIANWRVPVLLAAFLLGGTVIFYLGLPYVGGLTLRFMGLGGGVPVRLLVKSMNPGSSEVSPEEIAGCLIIGIGSEVLIKQVTNPGACAVTPPNPLVLRQMPTPYASVIRLSRSDVLRISGWPSEKLN